MKRQHRRLTELPPFDAGLTAALRRAFTPPEGVVTAEFDEMLARIR